MLRTVLALGASIVALLACASRPDAYFPPEALPPPDLLSSTSDASLTKLHLIIHFKQAGAYDEVAFVQTLQDPCHVLLHYVAAVSVDTHTYTMELPADRDTAATLQCLRGVASVGRVEIDQKSKAQ